MKKSTAITIYIELSQYRYLENEEKFILRTIIKNICNNFAEDTGYDKDNIDFVTLLKDSLKECKTGIPEYIFLLDGYNEMSKEMRGYFDCEMESVYEQWKNVRFVIAGRNKPVDINGKDEKRYLSFSKFRFSGIPDEELIEIIKTDRSDNAEKVLKDDRLMKVLHIPMFLAMFLYLKVDTEVSVRTRGEILDRFITETEENVAENISEKQTDTSINAEKRKFLIHFALPFAANTMDKTNSFYISELKCIKNIYKGIEIFNGNMEIRILCTQFDKFDTISDKEILSLISKETGYCVELKDIKDKKIEFIHQYFRDYFAAKHIQNILSAAQAMAAEGFEPDEQLKFINENGLNYTWSDDVCILLGEITEDYKNEPGYEE